LLDKEKGRKLIEDDGKTFLWYEIISQLAYTNAPSFENLL
jgi:hypothetical protein